MPVPNFDLFLPQFFDQNDRLLASATDLRIELNAAIFEDGTLVGADDESWLRETFSTAVEAKQDWYRGIIAALDAGHSVAEAFEPLDRFLNEWMPGCSRGIGRSTTRATSRSERPPGRGSGGAGK